MQHPISVTILTKNSETYLSEVLNALTTFDEVIICDTGSKDKTLEIAKQFSNVVIFERAFDGFGPTHNVASELAKNEWILSIDSDEIVTDSLVRELASINLNEEEVYAVPRNNEYRGQWIKGCGWYPDYQTRLYNRSKTKFSDAQVHESIITDGFKVVLLKSPIRHYSYNRIADFLTKMQTYSDLFAKQYQGKKHSSLFKALSHGLFAFFKSYFIKMGLQDGRAGFEISFYNANTAFYKYLKLAEANEMLKKTTEWNELRDVEKSADDQKKKEDGLNL